MKDCRFYLFPGVWWYAFAKESEDGVISVNWMRSALQIMWTDFQGVS